jgi:hypothetical protein
VGALPRLCVGVRAGAFSPCPHDGGTAPELLRGRELRVKSFDGE